MYVMTVCNDYYYSDELFVYALCRIFHRHAMIVCYDRVWTTINPQHTLSINELLDMCDLHLVFLRPGIYSELKLKKQHGCLPPPITDPSPPEFPAWSQNDSQMLSLPNLEGFVDSDLLKQYLNIKEEPDAPTGLVALSGGNTSLKDVAQTTIASADSYQTDTIVTGFTNDYLVSNVETDGTQIADIPMSTEEVTSLTTSNPVTLKTFCIQRINAAVTRTKPKTLMEYCIDFMSWNDQLVYPCCMQLPCSLNTNRHVAELQQIQAHPTEGTSLNESILYDHLKINTIVKDLWVQQAINRTYSVPIKKLTETEIVSWKPRSRTNTWEDIDPYSDLEDVGSSSESEHPSDKMNESTSSTESVISNIKQRLHTRKPVRHTTGRPTRKAACNINYKDLLHEDIRQTSKKPKKHPITLSSPSESRIAARGKRTKPPSSSHIILVKKPVKVEMPEPILDPQNLDPPAVTSNNINQDADEVDSSDDNIPLSELRIKQIAETTTAEKTVKK